MASTEWFEAEMKKLKSSYLCIGKALRCHYKNAFYLFFCIEIMASAVA